MDEAIIEKAARAICCPDGKCASETKPHGWLVPQPCNAVIYRAEARAVIPLIEAAAFERAIYAVQKEAFNRGRQECCGEPRGDGSSPLECCGHPDMILTDQEAIAAIRSLTEKQNGA